MTEEKKSPEERLAEIRAVLDVDDKIIGQFAANNRKRYLGFVDMLGFSRLVKADHAEAVRRYERLITTSNALRSQAVKVAKKYNPEVTHPDVQYWSDSVVIIGDDLAGVARAVQDVQTGALIGAEMISRGCISFGEHTQIPPSGTAGAYVVSQALAGAVAGEGRAYYPRVIIDDQIPDLVAEAKALSKKGSDLIFPCDDGIQMVHPFIFVGVEESAIYEVAIRDLVYKQRKDVSLPKYEWLYSQISRIESFFEEMAQSIAESYHDHHENDYE